jgi:hypothetical protein
VIIVLILTAVACGSGPSPEALERNQRPSTTTTTEPPPEGVTVIVINNGAFAPSILNIDLETIWIVRWENHDDVEYVISSQKAGVFESPSLAPGDSWEFDFSTVEPDVYRFVTFIGNVRIPGLIDSQPER